MADVKKFLESRKTEKQSQWKEKAKWIVENHSWLEKSRKVAIAILQKMDELNISQKELATKMGVTPQYICKALKGTENLSLNTIDNFEKALDTKLIFIREQATQQLQISTKWELPEMSYIGSFTSVNNRFYNKNRYSSRNRAYVA